MDIQTPDAHVDFLPPARSGNDLLLLFRRAEQRCADVGMTVADLRERVDACGHDEKAKLDMVEATFGPQRHIASYRQLLGLVD